MDILCWLFNVLVLWGENQTYYEIPNPGRPKVFQRSHLLLDFYINNQLWFIKILTYLQFYMSNAFTGCCYNYHPSTTTRLITVFTYNLIIFTRHLLGPDTVLAPLQKISSLIFTTLRGYYLYYNVRSWHWNRQNNVSTFKEMVTRTQIHVRKSSHLQEWKTLPLISEPWHSAAVPGNLMVWLRAHAGELEGPEFACQLFHLLSEVIITTLSAAFIEKLHWNRH